MKEFDIDKIGRKMPYQAPPADFFDKFTEDMLSQVKPRPTRLTTLRRLAAPISAIAAAFIVGIFLLYNNNSSEQEYIISDNLEESLSAYLDNLSDSELDYLAMEIYSQEDFYANLPENQ